MERFRERSHGGHRRDLPKVAASKRVQLHSSAEPVSSGSRNTFVCRRAEPVGQEATIKLG